MYFNCLNEIVRCSERSPILDSIGCALMRVIGREGIELYSFEGEDDLQPMNSDVVADDDDAVIVGPMLDKAFFSQLAVNARTISDTNWVLNPAIRCSPCSSNAPLFCRFTTSTNSFC